VSQPIAPHRFGIENATLHQCDFPFHAIQVGQMSRGKIIEHAHFIPSLDERVHNVRANEAAATSH
jgi:hypothetical protein